MTCRKKKTRVANLSHLDVSRKHVCDVRTKAFETLMLGGLSCYSWNYAKH